MNLKEICVALSREIHKLVPYDRAAINLPQGQNLVSVYAEESRLPASAIPEGVSVTEGTATGWVLEHGKPVTCRDVLQDSRFPLTHKRYQAVGIRSYVIFPLMAGGEVLGVFNLGSLTVDRFGKIEIDILSPIVEILSLAVENSRLYEESQKREEMQKLLKELSQDIAFLDIDSLLQKLTKKVCEVLKADVSDVRLMVEGDWRSLGVSGTEPARLQPASSGSRRGLSRLVMQNRKTFSIADMAAENSPHRRGIAARHGFRGYVGVPLFSRNGEVIGVLRVLTYQPRHFTRDEVDLVEQLARGTAMAIENAYLLEEARQKSLHLEALIKMNRDVASLLNRDVLLPRIANEARKFLNVDGASFRLVDGGWLLRAGYAGEEDLSALTPAMPLGQSISGEIVKENRVIAIRNVLEDRLIIEEHRRILSQAGYRSFLGVPLRLGQSVIGTINLYSKQEREFRPEEIQLITAFADQAAIAIENARLFGEVQKKSAELEDASKIKTDFLNTIAHELRTPLNVVIGTQQLLLDGAYGDLAAEQNMAILRMSRYAEDLLELINEVLDLMRLDARKVPVHSEEFSVREITDDLKVAFDPLARAKGLDLSFDIGAGISRLKSDRSKIREILQNLLANAVKYTDDGKVELRIALEDRRGTAEEQRVAWSVRDTGIGIGESDLPRLFEPFYMAEGVDRRKYPGSGLGLSIVKRLVELLGGDIKIESKLRKGTTFTVTLPAVHRSSESA
jgi:signal transduction histidine kinase